MASYGWCSQIRLGKVGLGKVYMCWVYTLLAEHGFVDSVHSLLFCWWCLHLLLLLTDLYFGVSVYRFILFPEHSFGCVTGGAAAWWPWWRMGRWSSTRSTCGSIATVRNPQPRDAPGTLTCLAHIRAPARVCSLSKGLAGFVASLGAKILSPALRVEVSFPTSCTAITCKSRGLPAHLMCLPSE